MPLCPKCGRKNIEGLGICIDCGAELSKGHDNRGLYNKEAFLLTVSDDMEAKIIESLLNSHDIPTLRKHRGSGGYTSLYMGRSPMGIDIYVPSSKLEEAMELTQSVTEITEDEYDEITYNNETMAQETPNYSETRNISRIIFTLLFVIPAVAGILYQAFKAIYYLITYGG